ncbi:nadh:flavin oxidoreductase [Stylonychia lemnae]|uniref:Nadh:flavin oxidoreductase n=1 Tax=Stylonychia lemnae TaxID=5949 RepID=A0A078A5P4_STYLE|nr:nadh:flavin oxidoreductase [Stylonychia lemnae]|eukprot:CDW76084.1 nadh:flavin oxidoreductase [Stylonychia lemnae]
MESQPAQQAILQKITLGDLELPNRVVVAALGRGRADHEARAPTDLHAQFYSNRASAGLIITECSAISQDGDSYLGSSNIYSEEQIQGWKKVVDAVHEKGGRIFLQIWHGGRTAHPDRNGGHIPLSSSPVAVVGGGNTLPGVVPKEATLEDIKTVQENFKRAAQNAKDAGFDGVEIHGAHGYIIDQFLRDGVNQRTDSYGGSVENRARFLLETVKEVLTVFTPQRVGVKFSPMNTFHTMSDSDPAALYSYVLQELSKLNIGFVEITEGFSFDSQVHQEAKDKFFQERTEKSVRELLKPHFTSGLYITNQGYTIESGNQAIESGQADLVSFGALFCANDNLVERIENGLTLNALSNVKDPEVRGKYLYSHLPDGYTDVSVYEAKE